VEYFIGLLPDALRLMWEVNGELLSQYSTTETGRPGGLCPSPRNLLMLQISPLHVWVRSQAGLIPWGSIWESGGKNSHVAGRQWETRK